MCHPKHHAPTFGSALEHGRAHQIDHQRRNFLRQLGIAGGASLMLGRMPLWAINASPLAYALNTAGNERILVVIRMKGGNDGLNTIIPVFDYGTYQQRRPTLAIPQQRLIGLDAAFAMPDTMHPLLPFWQGGQMKVVHSVGYPEQNLSHFRSNDIWGSASDADVNDTSGWLGRWLEGQYPDFLNHPPDVPPAIQIGGAGDLVFNNSEMINMGVVVQNPEQLAEIAQNGQLYDPLAVPECHYGDQLRFVRTIANSTFRYAGIIAQAYDSSGNQANYQPGLGQQLALVARLIKGNLGTRLYMVTIDGFDTHARQAEIHPYLMNQLAQAVSDFYSDLAAADRNHEVLCMTVSEFGRRIEQNASGGTDHGAAAPLLLFGNGLNGNGFVGDAPDLRNVDEVGNLQFHTDFRSIYATILENWLCIPSGTVDMVMGRSFDRIPQLGLDCAVTSSFTPTSPAPIPLNVWSDQGILYVQYEMSATAPVRVEVFDPLGRRLATLVDDYQPAGKNELTHALQHRGLALGQYIVRVQIGRQVAARKVVF